MSLLISYPNHFGELLLGQAQHNAAFARRAALAHPLLLTILVAYGLWTHRWHDPQHPGRSITQSPFMSTCQSHDDHLSQADTEEALLLFAKPISSCGVALHPPRDDGT